MYSYIFINILTELFLGLQVISISFFSIFQIFAINMYAQITFFFFTNNIFKFKNLKRHSTSLSAESLKTRLVSETKRMSAVKWIKTVSNNLLSTLFILVLPHLILTMALCVQYSYIPNLQVRKWRHRVVWELGLKTTHLVGGEARIQTLLVACRVHVL